MHFWSRVYIHVLVLIARGLSAPTNTSSCPGIDVVDLGYVKHRPSYYNFTIAGSILQNYNNVRFAQPPTGNRRFLRPAVPPFNETDGIRDGNISVWDSSCITSVPAEVPFPEINGTTWGNEDCLFLNVVKPNHVKEGDKVPVIHWVVGSAYAFGGKDWIGFGINALGIFNRPLNYTDKFILVTHNYRLGVPGWTPALEKGMDGNLGAWDSLAAIKWTKKYIHKFGGDPDQITVVGQSAGAGIIASLLTGDNGNLPLPFKQAFISSPGVVPRANPERGRPLFNKLLEITNCTTVDCLKLLPEADLKVANNYLVCEVPSNGGGGTLGFDIGFSPQVDGVLIKTQLTRALREGKVNKNITRLLVGSQAREGLGLSDDRDFPGRFAEVSRRQLPGLSNESIATLQSMYIWPPYYPAALAEDWTTDIVFNCPASGIVSAYKDIARRHYFSVPPAVHGQDISYFFFGTTETTPVESVDVAYTAETLLLDFVFGKGGTGSSASSSPPTITTLDMWPAFGDGMIVANITLQGFEIERLPAYLRRRCKFIDDLIVDPTNSA